MMKRERLAAGLYSGHLLPSEVPVNPRLVVEPENAF